MRIALVTSIRSKVGGAEAYVELLAGALVRAGHDIALWCEFDGALDQPIIALPSGTPTWTDASLGRAAALDALRSWRPDIIFSNGVSTHDLEAAILAVGPVVLFVHAYHGACISGGKSRLSPTRTPCARPLGIPCLLHYLPRRCGGLNPVAMARQYALETGRRDLLPRYGAILTASPHMRMEYLKYQLPPAKVHVVGLMIDQPESAGAAYALGGRAASSTLAREWRLLFMARLTKWKGGRLLFDALRHLRPHAPDAITLTVAGDGPERIGLQRAAEEAQRRSAGVQVRFAGWLDEAGRHAALSGTDLLVIPSVWPEPFGLVGPEAGLFGVPAAAFAVGGIPTWLRDGVNGHLAPGSPPTSRGLADAIVRCLRDPGHHARLSSGAVETARGLTAERHLGALMPILERVVRAAPAAARQP